ncbi:helix-turn-helix domain-containing protein [Methylocella sp.]|uniref:helix-turn-helix domain-containing protein n=1 Tax=Methylocella sp. TaxID=1978226 RepID=UPI00378478EC
MSFQSVSPFDDCPDGCLAAKILARAPAASRRPDPPESGEAAPQRPMAALPKWRMRRVVAYVEDNLGGRVSLAGMASAAGLSRMHFAAQFRRAAGLRPHDFLLRRRIERAQSMLRDTQAPLVDVALAVGFQTQPHFTTAFRRLVGETPHRWRCANRRAAR